MSEMNVRIIIITREFKREQKDQAGRYSQVQVEIQAGRTEG